MLCHGGWLFRRVTSDCLRCRFNGSRCGDICSLDSTIERSRCEPSCDWIRRPLAVPGSCGMPVIILISTQQLKWRLCRHVGRL